MRAQFLRTPEIGPGNVFEKLLIGFWDSLFSVFYENFQRQTHR